MEAKRCLDVAEKSFLVSLRINIKYQYQGTDISNNISTDNKTYIQIEPK